MPETCSFVKRVFYSYFTIRNYSRRRSFPVNRSVIVVVAGDGR